MTVDIDLSGERSPLELAVANMRYTMDSNELRELQAPLKEKYRADPEAAAVTLTARGDLADGAIACKVETGRAFDYGDSLQDTAAPL